MNKANEGGLSDTGHHPGAAVRNWLMVELSEPGANGNAVGGGHASGHSGFVHIGLGRAERAEIRIKWPDGEWSHAYKAFADNFVRIDRGKSAPGYWLPPPPAGTDAALPASTQ
jgi:hypothetical protein